MTGLALLNKSGHKFRLSLAIAVASFLWTITLQTRAVPKEAARKSCASADRHLKCMSARRRTATRRRARPLWHYLGGGLWLASDRFDL